MSAGYELSQAAEADLREIIRYTNGRWGQDQARTYVEEIERGLTSAAAGTGHGKALDHLHPGLRVARCRHHYLFCLARNNAPMLVVAILHERMDLVARLKGRLG